MTVYFKVSYICHRAININQINDWCADSHCFSLSQSPLSCFTHHNDLNHVFATTRSSNCQFSIPKLEYIFLPSETLYFCLILQWLCSVIMLAFILNKSTNFIFLTRNRSLVTPQQSYSQLNVEQWSLIPYRKTSSICREIYLLYQHVKERLLNTLGFEPRWWGFPFHRGFWNYLNSYIWPLCQMFNNCSRSGIRTRMARMKILNPNL